MIFLYDSTFLVVKNDAFLVVRSARGKGLQGGVHDQHQEDARARGQL